MAVVAAASENPVVENPAAPSKQESLGELINRLGASANALAALGAALDARTSGAVLDASIQPHVEEVLAALGIGSLDNVSPLELRASLGEIRAFTLTNAKLLFAASRGSGWRHMEPEILEAAGEVSSAFPQRLEHAIAPQLEGLADRLKAPGAKFLDVGVGVAALAIEMARAWPSLRVVGIDPWAPALSLARQNVRTAGLDDRIELREQAGEALRDVDAFELAWIPGLFVPEVATAAVLERVHCALRPGGWLLFPTLRPGGDRLAASLARLRIAMFGGFDTTPDKLEDLVRGGGFVDVRTLPGPKAALTALVVGRRQP